MAKEYKVIISFKDQSPFSDESFVNVQTFDFSALPLAKGFLSSKKDELKDRLVSAVIKSVQEDVIFDSEKRPRFNVVSSFSDSKSDIFNTSNPYDVVNYFTDSILNSPFTGIYELRVRILK